MFSVSTPTRFIINVNSYCKHPTPMKKQLHPQCLIGVHCSMEIPLDIASVWY